MTNETKEIDGCDEAKEVVDENSPYYLGHKQGEVTAKMIAAVTKGGLGLIPGVGPALSEVVTQIIPDMRLSRALAYLELLQKHFDEDTLKKFSETPDKIAIIEEGIYTAGLTSYVSRVERIAYAVSHGLTKEDLDADQQSAIVRVIKDISDAEAIILEYHGLNGGKYVYDTQGKEFQSRYPEIWVKYPSLPKRADNERPTDEELRRYNEQKAIYKKKENYVANCIQHLTSLGLLKTHSKNRLPRSVDISDNQDIRKINSTLRELLEDSEHIITQFGLDVLDAIKEPCGPN